MKTNLLFYILFFFTYLSIGQSYTGTVLDAKTDEPLVGVVVYFDGTTIGVVTNPEGVFKIESLETINANLVISHLGYETKTIDKSSLKNNSIIKLEEQTTFLKEVFISDDDWSRRKKLNYFRTEFLGKTKHAKYCEILNENKIELRFSKVDNTLYANVDEPIIIKNEYLGYIVEYNLIDFEIKFKKNQSNMRVTDVVVFSGTTVFKELNPDTTKAKHIKNRNQVYQSSLLYFMRSLANNNLVKNKFRLSVKDSINKSELFIPKPVDSVFKTEKTEDNLTKVTLLQGQEIAVRVEDSEKSTMVFSENKTTFFIDNFGLYSPSNSLFFGGVYGDHRIATMLPSDFKLNNKQ